MTWVGIPGRPPVKSGGVAGPGVALPVTLTNAPTTVGLNEGQAESWGDVGSRGRGYGEGDGRGWRGGSRKRLREMGGVLWE